MKRELFSWHISAGTSSPNHRKKNIMADSIRKTLTTGLTLVLAGK